MNERPCHTWAAQAEKKEIRASRAARSPLSRRERRKRETREALFDATRALLASRSIDALSVDEIAERADIAKGTFYNYFADKDELARQLAAHTRAKVEERIASVNAGIGDPAQRIARAFCCLLRYGLRDPLHAAAMMRLFPHATDPSAPLNAGVRGDVMSGLSRGRIVDISEDAATAAIMGVFIAGLNRAMDLGARRTPAFARELGALLLRGLGLGRAEARRVINGAIDSVLLGEVPWESRFGT